MNFELHFSTDRFCKFPFARDGGNSTFLAASPSTVSIKGKTKVLKLISLAECKGRTCAVWATPGAGHRRLSGEKGPGEGSLPRVPPYEYQAHGRHLTDWLYTGGMTVSRIKVKTLCTTCE